MSKKFKNQNCIYCLDHFKKLTKDHIFPRSWYPKSTPQDMEKWVVPACFECNNRLGKIEDEAYKKLAICIGSSNIAASGISEKAIRLYDLQSAKNKKDRRRREANLKKIIPDLMYTHKISNGFLKNFGPLNNNPNESISVRISMAELLDPIAKKIVRGLEFKLIGKLINNDKNIAIIHLTDSIEVIPSELTQLNNILEKSGTKTDRGPGFVVRYVKDIHASMVYHITIWGKWEIWASAPGKGLGVNF